MKPNETLSNPTKLGKKNSVKLSALCITDWTNEDIENNDSMVFIFAYYICITEFLPSFAQNFIAHQWNIVRLEIFHRLKKKFQKTVRILFFSFLSFNSQADPVLPSFYWVFLWIRCFDIFVDFLFADLADGAIRFHQATRRRIDGVVFLR